MLRRGTTLIEVLIAIFIMALGLIALLTLFPIGAVQMARAIQDERAAQVAANGASYFRWYWKNMVEAEEANVTVNAAKNNWPAGWLFSGDSAQAVSQADPRSKTDP